MHSFLQVILAVGGIPLLWRLSGWIMSSLVDLGPEYEVWGNEVGCGGMSSASALPEYGVCGVAAGLLHNCWASVEYLLHLHSGGSPWFQQTGRM